jgi:hypothetical protein
MKLWHPYYFSSNPSNSSPRHPHCRSGKLLIIVCRLFYHTVPTTNQQILVRPPKKSHVCQTKHHGVWLKAIRCQISASWQGVLSDSERCVLGSLSYCVSLSLPLKTSYIKVQLSYSNVTYSKNSSNRKKGASLVCFE